MQILPEQSTVFLARIGQTHQNTLTTQTAVFHQFLMVFHSWDCSFLSFATKTNQKMLAPLNSHAKKRAQTVPGLPFTS